MLKAPGGIRTRDLALTKHVLYSPKSFRFVQTKLPGRSVCGGRDLNLLVKTKIVLDLEPTKGQDVLK